MNPDLHRRLRVLRLRQRVEICSWTIYTTCFGLPSVPRRHSQVRKRLALLPAWAVDDFADLRAEATQMHWVYEQCCEVLHGRQAHSSLTEAVVSSWEAIVVAGEETVARRCRPVSPAP